ncbi:MBOAT, membrane-bound O-acyltransferase family-domain-containing protein [Dipodascopsis tothii]|uniref:MBOAT, membrane-bound O-acyltransferase family-domain-containing protein n=1 Tax=Dipodascopsis tothii TaxID=44089 RepID=UPI0034CDCC33
MMNVLSVFSLEVLDSRICSSTEKAQNVIRNAPPSRWRSKEFMLYYVVLVTVVPQMFMAAIKATNEESSPSYALIEPFLEDGWMFGRKIDNSDLQYSSFRDRIIILLTVLALHQCLRRLSGIFRVRRPHFDLVFGVIFVSVLHGLSFIKMLIIYGLNFAISRYLPQRPGIALTWVFGIALLFLNEWNDGYRFGQIHSTLSPLDSYRGMIERWDVSFNFSMLRMISYNADYYSSLSSMIDVEKRERDEKKLTEKERVELPSPRQEYHFANYLAYLLYTPLYIAGPIVTFNDYLYQSRHKLSTVRLKSTLQYGIRLAIIILVMEWCLHFMYVVSLSRVKAWSGLSPFQISMVAYFNLTLVWMKLVIPWRFFRLWALIDDIDPPENMLRCMSNNYSAGAFWRSWHRSYNRWVIRYIYIPLQGSKYPIRNMLIVFTFVAVWHDIQLKMLAWGWLITLFVLPEVFAKMLFPAKKWKGRPQYRFMSAVGAVCNIWLMMIANLVGFVVGLDGARDLFSLLFTTYSGLFFVTVASMALFVGVMLMYEVRSSEERRGISIRC